MVITKKSPLSILNHLRVINLTCLKQRLDDCLFQVSFYLYNFFLVFTIILYIYHFFYIYIISSTNVLQPVLLDLKKESNMYN